MKSITTREIADHVSGRLIGPDDIVVTSLEQLDQAQPGQLTFIGDYNHALRWPTSHASAALVSDGLDIQPVAGRALIMVQNADLAMADLLTLFSPRPVHPPVGVHPTAVISPDAILGELVRIGPYCVIGSGVRIGDRCVLHASVTIMDHTVVGQDVVFWPGVVIRDCCQVGNRCIFHMNVCIGGDGFGYRPGSGPHGPYLVKIPHIGTVQIGDDVEIGAGTCVDRGKFSATIIGEGTKIDNLVQIGHNCRIGRMVLIAGGCAIGGSVTIEDGVQLGGMVAMKDHIHVGKGARVAGMSGLTKNLPAGETWMGTPAKLLRQHVRELSSLESLPDLVKQMKQG